MSRNAIRALRVAGRDEGAPRVAGAPADL